MLKSSIIFEGYVGFEVVERGQRKKGEGRWAPGKASDVQDETLEVRPAGECHAANVRYDSWSAFGLKRTAEDSQHAARQEDAVGIPVNHEAPQIMSLQRFRQLVPPQHLAILHLFPRVFTLVPDLEVGDSPTSRNQSPSVPVSP